MAKYNDNDINFNNVSLYGISIGTKILNADYLIDENRNITSCLPIINSIDIDWNDATLADGTVIKKTSHLLKYIQTLNDRYNSLLEQYNGLVEEIDRKNYTVATAINDLYDKVSNVGNVSYDDPRLKQYINDIIYEYMHNQHQESFMYVGNEIPNSIDSNNGTIINSLDEIFIYKENDTEEDVDWYFAIPNNYSYEIYDDQKLYSQEDFFELVNSNFLNKYLLYKSKTQNRVISVILTKIDN